MFAEHEDEAAEAAAVARKISELLDAGTPASEIAVLYRVNAQSEAYEQALAELDIPYLVRGGERFFARTEVRQAMAALRTANVRKPAGELPKLVRELLVPLGLTDEPPAGGAARERWESLLALVELAEELASTVEGADLAQYVVELDMRARAQHPPTVEGVTLASLHAAKGLEWDAVFLVGLVEGTVPILHADGNDAAIEEERRLLYVGVTRARQFLSLSWAIARSESNRRPRRRSRFLYGLIPEDHPTVAARTSPPAARASSRRCAGCAAAQLVGAVATKLGRCSLVPGGRRRGTARAAAGSGGPSVRGCSKCLRTWCSPTRR